MKVREAIPEDAPAICEVHERAIEELGARAYDEEQVTAWRGDRDPDDYDLDSGRLYFDVAEVDGAVRGFGSLNYEPGEHLEASADAEVTAVYVHPEFVRRGIGSALLSALEREAVDCGRNSIALWSSLNAVGFYERQGYERVAEHTHEFGNSAPGRVIEMRRILRR